MSYYEPMSGPLPTPPAPARRTPRWPWIVATCGVLVAALGVLFGLGVFRGLTAPTAPATFTMTGWVQVHGGPYTAFVLDGNGGCSGTGGFSDMTPGTAVTVANSTGQVLATGALGTGRYDNNGVCALPISVPGVPQGLTQYSVTVSHRGTQVVSADEATSSVELSLGGN